MLISTIVLILSFVPFIYSYEKRKVKAREVVLLAVMSSLTVVSNLICAYTVPFHAGTAMVIITGIALGPQSGFLVGAMSRFVCNFFMGQGAWTAWEMFAWGVLGALAGIMFNKAQIIGHLDDKKQVYRKQLQSGISVIISPLVCLIVSEVTGYIHFLFTSKTGETFFGWRLYVFGIIGVLAGVILQRKKMPANFVTMTVFTFISVFVVYGGIMNLATFFMTRSVYEGGIDSLLLLYVTGAPYDIMHAFTAAICVFLFGDNITRKIERVKVKYGL